MKASELEFRVWDNSNGENLATLVYSNHPSFNEKLSEFWEWVEGKGGKIPMMRYTGIKDEKGVKIFEGDIVVHQWGGVKRVGVIGFWCGEFLGCHVAALRSGNRMPGRDATGNCWYFGLAVQRCMPNAILRVVGNVYQNQSLLSTAEVKTLEEREEG